MRGEQRTRRRQRLALAVQRDTCRRKGCTAVAVALLVASVGPLARPSSAYVRTRPSGRRTPVRWREPSLNLTLDARTLPAGMERSEAIGAARRAAAAWSGVACSSLQITITEGDVASGSNADGLSTVAFRTRAWCLGGIRRVGRCHDPRAAAMTTLRLGRRPRGQGDIPITEADIELNAVHFAWSAAKDERTSGTVDLVTVLLHELGHVIGLAHVCRRGEDAAHRLPSCEAATTAVASSVMVPAGDVAGALTLPLRRALAPDDRRAACALYPRSPRSSP